MDKELSEMQTLLMSHVEDTVARVREHPVVVAVQETTSLYYTEHAARDFFLMDGTQEPEMALTLHDTLAFTTTGTPLGLLDVQAWARVPKAGGERQRRRGPRPAETGIAQCLRSYRAVAQTQRLCPATMLICVAECDADPYELFAEAAPHPEGPLLLVRVQRGRAAGKGRKPTPAAKAEGEAATQPDDRDLWERLAATPVAGEAAVAVPGRTSRLPRTANLAVRHASVELPPPPGESLPPCRAWAVFAQEIGAPEGAIPLEWMLLTTAPTDEFAAAEQCVQWYTQCWGIEAYHDTLKDGCRPKERRRTVVDGIPACLAVDLAMAWRVLLLMKLSRETPDMPCGNLLSEPEVTVVCVMRGIPIGEASPTLGQVVRGIAGLAGFLGRKGDGDPGTLTVWGGLDRLEPTVEGFLLARGIGGSLLDPDDDL